MHLTRTIALLLLLIPVSVAWAQNLVPNPYFGDISSCPDTRGLIHFAPPWYSANGTTVDLIHACGTNNTSIPRNRWGLQDPFIGNGYAGIRTYFHNTRETGSFQNYREYLSTPLIDTLEKAKAYLVGFWYSPGESGGYISDDLGLALVDSVPSWEILPFEPVIANPQGQIIETYTIWKRMQGTYVAAGNEKHLVIGNFKNDSLTTIEEGGVWDTLFNSTYYFIDNVSVRPCLIQPQDSILISPQAKLCAGDTLTLHPNLGLPIASFHWFDGDTHDTLLVHNVSLYGIEVVDSLGCVFRDSIFLERGTDPAVDLGGDKFLCPDEGVLLITEPEAETEYQWNTGQKGHYLYANQSGTFTLSANRFGCKSRDSVRVAFHPEPPYDLGFDSLICQGASIELGFPFAGAAYLWEDGFNEARKTVREAGVYYLELQTPCFFRSVSYRIGTLDCDCTDQIPNLFSPNDDGINDYWQIPLSTGAEVVQWGIRDRWGRLLLESTEQATPQWDGRFQGKSMSPGVYYWWLNYLCWDGEQMSLQQAQGHLSLIR